MVITSFAKSHALHSIADMIRQAISQRHLLLNHRVVKNWDTVWFDVTTRTSIEDDHNVQCHLLPARWNGALTAPGRYQHQEALVIPWLHMPAFLEHLAVTSPDDVTCSSERYSVVAAQCPEKEKTFCTVCNLILLIT